MNCILKRWVYDRWLYCHAHFDLPPRSGEVVVIHGETAEIIDTFGVETVYHSLKETAEGRQTAAPLLLCVTRLSRSINVSQQTIDETIANHVERGWKECP